MVGQAFRNVAFQSLDFLWQRLFHFGASAAIAWISVLITAVA
jgi:hypothetical protein